MAEASTRPSPTEGLTEKGERTRNKILEVALTLFRERGYEDTTMRAVAEGAGVSLGNAYYYFRSKDHLIHGYYAQSHRDHLEVCEPLLRAESDLLVRLRGVLNAKITTSAPYHRFAGTLFRSAADPKSPLNPFAEESRDVRQQATELMGRVVSGSETRVAGPLSEDVPELLWLYLMGVILFWIHDDSPDTRRTYRLIDHTSRIVARLVRLASNPLLRPVAQATVRLLQDLREESEGARVEAVEERG